MLKEKNNPEKGRERWEMEDLGISWDILPQMTRWDGKLYHSHYQHLHMSPKRRLCFPWLFYLSDLAFLQHSSILARCFCSIE